jgi:peptide/nickel transport system permease protein
VVRYIAQRLLLLPFLMVVYSFVIFVIIKAPPGDFLTAYVANLSASGTSITTEMLQALRHDYGLDQPFIIQYFHWMQNLLHGNMGLSLEYQRPNADLIREQLTLTIALALMSFVLTWVIAVPAGIYSATHQRSIIDHVFTVIKYVDAPWSFARLGDLIAHIWLPAIVLGIAGTARLTRIMRANLLDELNKPYVVTARAKGMREWRLVLRYPVRLALNPLISTIGWYLPALFSGSLIVATVMNLPNIGPLLLRALINQDMYLAGGILLIYSFLTIVGTLLSDVLLALIDPRIRMEN